MNWKCMLVAALNFKQYKLCTVLTMHNRPLWLIFMLDKEANLILSPEFKHKVDFETVFVWKDWYMITMDNLFECLFVCKKDYTETTCSSLSGRMQRKLGKTPFNFGVIVR